MRRSQSSGNRFAAPALLLLALVTIYPLLHALYLSLHRSLPIFGIWSFAGLETMHSWPVTTGSGMLSAIPSTSRRCQSRSSWPSACVWLCS